MKTVKVNLGRRGYNIYIGKDVLKKLSSMSNLIEEKPIFVVTNEKINSLYGAKLKKYLKPLSAKMLFYEVPDSEKAKSSPIYLQIIEKLARFAIKAKPFIVAFGGGVITDLAGFVASTYKRGVPYMNIPTTLLAQVDSAIGGKVAIDMKIAKNIIGNFFQPKAVICDLIFLNTLPEKELRNGLVEIVKYGIIKDRDLFYFITKNLSRILKRDISVLEHVIYKSCAIKARIVEKDEYDTKGVRAILNFGHTIGHAIETSCYYSKYLTHGQAVAVGMVMANHIACRLGMLKESECQKINSLIRKVALKVKIKELHLKSILKTIAYDKKFVSGVNRFILPKKIGSVKIVDNVSQKLIEEAIRKSISYD